MKCIDSQYRHLSDRQLETHQQGTSLADFSSKCVFGRKAIDTFFGYVTVPSALGGLTNTYSSSTITRLFNDYDGTERHKPRKKHETPPQNCSAAGFAYAPEQPISLISSGFRA